MIATINNQITDQSALPADLLSTVVNLTLRNRINEAANIIYDDDSNTYTSLNFTQIVNILITVNRTTSISLKYPAQIAVPDDDTYIISSSTFTYNGQSCTIKNKLSSNILQVVAENATVQVDNLGTWTGDTVTINYFTPTALFGGVDYVKLAVIPANQSAIAPERNDIISYDASASRVIAVTTAAES